MNWVMEHENDGDISQQPKIKQKAKHDKPKPWDDDPNIDHGKIDKFDLSWNETGMLEVSSFSTLFPGYREKHLQEVWPTVKSTLKEYGISCEHNLVEGSMTVSTTRKSRDLYVIIKARDHIKLLSRSFPVHQGQLSTSFFTLVFMSILYEISVAFQRCETVTEMMLPPSPLGEIIITSLTTSLERAIFKAIKILDGEMQCDLIKTCNLVHNRRQGVFQSMSEGSNYYSSSNGHVCDKERCVVRTSLSLHNFGRRFYGCREWTPDEDRHCNRWLDSNTCTRGAQTAPIVIARLKRLKNEANLANEREKEARASEEEAREKETAAKRKAEKAKAAQRIAEEKMNKYKQALIVSWVLFLVFYLFSTRIGVVGRTELYLL